MIAQTLHFSYTEIMRMPEHERLWWYNTCVDYTSAVQMQAKQATSE